MHGMAAPLLTSFGGLHFFCMFLSTRTDHTHTYTINICIFNTKATQIHIQPWFLSLSSCLLTFSHALSLIVSHTHTLTWRKMVPLVSLVQRFERWKLEGLLCRCSNSAKLSWVFLLDVVQQFLLSQPGQTVVCVTLFAALLSRKACSFFVSFRQAEMWRAFKFWLIGWVSAAYLAMCVCASVCL